MKNMLGRVIHLKFKNISDCHTHSNHSYDGNDSLLSMCEKAKELNLLYFTVTDHCECERLDLPPHPYRPVNENSYKEMLIMKDKFPFFLTGVELGQPFQELKIANNILKKDYDFVIGSLHNVKGEEDFYYWDNDSKDCDEYLKKYFKEICEMINWGKFDTLAHLTYPLRYMRDSNGGFLSFDPYLDDVKEIFSLLMDREIALEVNTSGLRQNLNETLPGKKLLKLYKDMGGKLLTIGSDAHRLDDMVKGIPETLEMLKEIGFDYYTVYKDRKPMMITIE